MPQGGFLILGHDVDKYTPSASQLWDQVQNTKYILIKANEKFLAVWIWEDAEFLRRLEPTQLLVEETFPEPDEGIGSVLRWFNNAWNITKWLSEGKIWADYFIECWLTRPSINQSWTTGINTIPGQGIDKNIDGAHKFEDVITFCSIPFHVSSHQCFVFYDLWKWVNFSLELSHRHFIDETGLFILGDLENIVLTSVATDLAWLRGERWWLGWIIDAKSAPGEFMNQTHRI